MKGPVQSVEVSLIIHATEDKARVTGAVAAALGVSVPLEESEMEGHFGNPITLVSYHLTGDEAAEAFASLVKALPEGQKAAARANMALMLDEHSALYLRLDKQALVQGRLALGGSDPVRVRVKPRLFALRGGAEQYFKGALGG